MATTSAANGHSAEFCIAIIGGGFTGLSLAIGLQRYGVQFIIYEASDTFSELGAGITFAPNGVRAMYKIDPAIQQEFLRLATRNGLGSQRDVFLDCRDGRTENAQLLWPIEGNAYRSIHRAAFLSILVKMLPRDSIRFNKRLENITQTDGAVRLSFSDGTKSTAAAVIGCDGVRSSVRRFVYAQEPKYSGIYSYRGLAKMDRAIQTIGETLAMTGQIYAGDGAHVITYPIEQGTVLNIVGCKYDVRGEWPNQKWQIPSSQENLKGDFSHFGAAARRVLSLVETYDHWAGFDLPTPLPPFWRGRIALAGDAAHCTTPHIGAGVSMALEDAFVLARLMSGVNNSQDIEVAFKAFDSCRRPRTEKLIVESRAAASIYQFRSTGDRDPARELRNRFDWIWNIDLDEHLRMAQKVFHASK